MVKLGTTNANKLTKYRINMQEALIQKILALTKCTFARRPSSKGGCRKRILEGDKFSKKLSEIATLMKQVNYDIYYVMHLIMYISSS